MFDSLNGNAFWCLPCCNQIVRFVLFCFMYNRWLSPLLHHLGFTLWVSIFMCFLPHQFSVLFVQHILSILFVDRNSIYDWANCANESTNLKVTNRILARSHQWPPTCLVFAILTFFCCCCCLSSILCCLIFSFIHFIWPACSENIFFLLVVVLNVCSCQCGSSFSEPNRTNKPIWHETMAFVCTDLYNFSVAPILTKRRFRS